MALYDAAVSYDAALLWNGRAIANPRDFTIAGLPQLQGDIEIPTGSEVSMIFKARKPDGVTCTNSVLIEMFCRSYHAYYHYPRHCHTYYPYYIHTTQFITLFLGMLSLNLYLFLQLLTKL